MQTRRSINKSVFIISAMIKKICVKSYSSFLIVKKLIQAFFLRVCTNISTVKVASIHSCFRTCGRISFLFPGDTIWIWFSSFKKWLTHSWRRPISYRIQSIDLLRNSMDWFLYVSASVMKWWSRTCSAWSYFKWHFFFVIFHHFLLIYTIIF